MRKVIILFYFIHKRIKVREMPVNSSTCQPDQMASKAPFSYKILNIFCVNHNHNKSYLVIVTSILEF